MVDLRKDKRAPASLKVKYKSATVAEFSEQFGGDVSRNGIFIKTKKPIEIGALLKLELQLSDASPVIHGIGRVCWRREPGPDPSLPAGMGIKFIKLDPDSRGVVEEIVQSRGERPSRFDQTRDAEVAPPSQAPPALESAGTPDVLGELRSGPPPPAAAPSPRAPVARPAAPAARATAAPLVPQRGMAPAPRVGAAPVSPSRRGDLPPPPASVLRQGSPTANRPSGVAGLFANSPITKNPPAEQSPEVSPRSSFFPPAPSPKPAGSSRPAPGSVGSGRLAPPPATLGRQGSGSDAGGLKPSSRVSQARQSGQFLAAAFAEGGVAEKTATQARAAAERSEDALIDELFAGVVDEPPRAASVPSPTPSAPANVEDVFAALSEEEGLDDQPTKERPIPVFPRASSPGSAAAGRSAAPAVLPPQRGSSPGARPSTPQARGHDSVDDLFAELDARDAGRTSSPRVTATALDALDEPQEDRDSDLGEDRDDELGGANTDEFGEADLFGSQSLPPRPSLPAGAASAAAPMILEAAPQPLEPAPRSAALIWIFALLLAVGGAGGFFYYQRFLAPQPEQTPGAPAADVAPEPAAALPAPAAQPGAPPTAERVAEKPAAEPAAPTQPSGAEKPAPPAGTATAGAAQTIELEVSSLPRDSDITVDGKRVGTTPKHVVLPLGREAQVTVSSAGYAPMTKKITASADSEPLRFRLEPLPYSLVVISTPPEAELVVGQHRALSPAPLELGHLDGGVQVSVAKDGYQRMTRLVRIDEFVEKNGVMRAEVQVTLSPLPGGAQAAAARQRAKRAALAKQEAAAKNAPNESPPAPSEAAPSEAAPKAGEPAGTKPAPEGPTPQAAPSTMQW